MEAEVTFLLSGLQGQLNSCAAVYRNPKHRRRDPKCHRNKKSGRGSAKHFLDVFQWIFTNTSQHRVGLQNSRGREGPTQRKSGKNDCDGSKKKFDDLLKMTLFGLHQRSQKTEHRTKDRPHNRKHPRNIWQGNRNSLAVAASVEQIHQGLAYINDSLSDTTLMNASKIAVRMTGAKPRSRTKSPRII